MSVAWASASNRRSIWRLHEYRGYVGPERSISGSSIPSRWCLNADSRFALSRRREAGIRVSGAVCRSCGLHLRHLMCDLGSSPLSNAYLDAAALARMEPTYPLSVYVCERCFLVQLPACEAPEQIFSEYAYFSSFSDSWLQHAKAYAQSIRRRIGLSADSLVVELASNDGYLLRNFVAEGIPVLGIEPAANVAQVAIERRVPTITEFFGQALAERLADDGMQADLVVANNVLAHVPDINDFVAGIKLLLKLDGMATLEFPHLLRLMAATQFDTIYHEHYSYLSLMALDPLFARHGLQIVDLDELPTHGGSLRIYVRHRSVSAQSSSALQRVRSAESDAGLANLSTYTAFQSRVQTLKRDILRFVFYHKDAERSFAGYGAPAKGNTLLNYCGLGTDCIDFVVDRNPAKQGTYLPGSRIPVLSPEALREHDPDLVIIMPWNLKTEICDQLRAQAGWRADLVTLVPAPQLEL